MPWALLWLGTRRRPEFSSDNIEDVVDDDEVALLTYGGSDDDEDDHDDHGGDHGDHGDHGYTVNRCFLNIRP